MDTQTTMPPRTVTAQTDTVKTDKGKEENTDFWEGFTGKQSY